MRNATPGEAAAGRRERLYTGGGNKSDEQELSGAGSSLFTKNTAHSTGSSGLFVFLQTPALVKNAGSIYSIGRRHKPFAVPEQHIAFI